MTDLSKEINENPSPPLEEERWEDRLLCVDGSCIGVLDTRGHCKICGQYNPEFEMQQSRPCDESLEVTPPPIPADKNEEEDFDKPAEISGDDEERVCCPDELCVGIINKEGICGTCRKPYKP